MDALLDLVAQLISKNEIDYINQIINTNVNVQIISKILELTIKADKSELLEQLLIKPKVVDLIKDYDKGEFYASITFITSYPNSPKCAKLILKPLLNESGNILDEYTPSKLMQIILICIHLQDTNKLEAIANSNSAMNLISHKNYSKIVFDNLISSAICEKYNLMNFERLEFFLALPNIKRTLASYQCDFLFEDLHLTKNKAYLKHLLNLNVLFHNKHNFQLCIKYFHNYLEKKEYSLAIYFLNIQVFRQYLVNNKKEYLIKYCLNNNFKALDIFLDSRLIDLYSNQVIYELFKKSYKIKNFKVINYLFKLKNVKVVKAREEYVSYLIQCTIEQQNLCSLEKNYDVFSPEIINAVNIRLDLNTEVGLKTFNCALIRNAHLVTIEMLKKYFNSHQILNEKFAKLSAEDNNNSSVIKFIDMLKKTIIFDNGATIFTAEYIENSLNASLKALDESKIKLMSDKIDVSISELRSNVLVSKNLLRENLLIEVYNACLKKSSHGKFIQDLNKKNITIQNTISKLKESHIKIEAILKKYCSNFKTSLLTNDDLESAKLENKNLINLIDNYRNGIDEMKAIESPLRRKYVM